MTFENSSSGYKKKRKVSLQRTNDQFRPNEADGVYTWDIIHNKHTVYDAEMAPFILKESKKMLEDSIKKSEKILKRSRKD